MDSEITKNALENFIKFNDRETPEKMKEVASRDLGETEELKQKCLQELKALIKDNRLACITTDDFLLRFLRTEKFNVKGSFERLWNYSKQRINIHEKLLDLRPEILEKCLRLNVFGYLPYRDTEESLIFFHTTGRWTPSICSDDELKVGAFVLANYASEKEYSQITGAVLVFDNSRIPLSHVAYLLPHLPGFTSFLFKSLPMRYRAVHTINEGSIIKYVLRLLDPFIPKKLKERIFFHGKTRDKFFQYLPPCIIPDDYEGTLGPLSNDHLVDEMLDYLQKMKDEQRYFLQENI